MYWKRMVVVGFYSSILAKLAEFVIYIYELNMLYM